MAVVSHEKIVAVAKERKYLSEVFLCNLSLSSSGKTTIYKNENGIYCADLTSGELPFNRAKDLYSAFVWFHSHLEEYAETLAEAY